MASFSQLVKKQRRLIFGLVALFALSRMFVFLQPPCCFSDVTAYYERYANTWRYGLTPYREHLYEYPPGSIPLLSVPLELDQLGIGTYYPNFRAQILIVDTVFFAFLLATSLKLSTQRQWFQTKWWLGLLAYIALTTLAKDFLYEGLDLTFATTFLSSILAWVWLDKRQTSTKVLSWTLFWLSASLKFLTLPMMVPLALLLNDNLKKNLLAFGIGFVIIWGIPLGLYRSSLAVSFVYNNQRPLKYASFPSHLIQWANTFTNTEVQINQEPDFQFEGPISTQVTQAVKVIFPLAIAAVLALSSWQILKQSPLDDLTAVKLGLTTYGLYVFVLFVTAKIFSQPFHLWYLPLLAIMPWPKKWFGPIVAMSALMVGLDTTSLLAVPNTWQTLTGKIAARSRESLRFIPMFAMIGVWLTSLTSKSETPST